MKKHQEIYIDARIYGCVDSEMAEKIKDDEALKISVALDLIEHFLRQNPSVIKVGSDG